MLYNVNPTLGGALIYTAMGDGTSQPVGIVGAVRATGLSASSIAAQIVSALQAAGLAARHFSIRGIMAADPTRNA